MRYVYIKCGHASKAAAGILCTNEIIETTDKDFLETSETFFLNYRLFGSLIAVVIAIYTVQPVRKQNHFYLH